MSTAGALPAERDAQAAGRVHGPVAQEHAAQDEHGADVLREADGALVVTERAVVHEHRRVVA